MHSALTRVSYRNSAVCPSPTPRYQRYGLNQTLKVKSIDFDAKKSKPNQYYPISPLTSLKQLKRSLSMSR